MNLMQRVIPAFLAGLLVMVLLPFAAGAAGDTETVTIQVNTTTPGGTRVIGTVTAVRHLGNPVQTDITFRGMVNGAPVTVSASGTEQWSGGGSTALRINSVGAAPASGDLSASFSITSVSNWPAAIPQPPLPFGMDLAQSGGVATLNGVPLAISGPLPAPGSGNVNLTITNAGQGPTTIDKLPNTGAGPAGITPWSIAGTLIGLGLLLVGLSRLIGRRRPVAAPDAR